MKRGAHTFFTLFLLLGFAAQPLLVQARVIDASPSPCPMPMQQMAHGDMAAHADCANHSNQLCSDCDLCSLSSSSALPSLSIWNEPAPGSTSVSDSYRGAFVSIALPVDSPPPRNL